ncbi:unnamed protein product, partial [Clonostachys rosea f. rosea IK726]
MVEDASAATHQEAILGQDNRRATWIRDSALRLIGRCAEALGHAPRAPRKGTAELTFGATDPVAVSQMAKHMRTVYVSGGLSGFSENNYPGMDHADYADDGVW